MGNSTSTKCQQKSNIKSSTLNNITHVPPFQPLCGSILKTREKNEIVLTSTYAYPKGTYSLQSTVNFSSKERMLFMFVERNNIPALRYLIIKGVNINILDEDRTSPLHLACRCSSVQMVEEIINQGGMLNIPDIVGWTPLHVACFYSRADIILMLLKLGAKENTKNRDKLTPRELIDPKVKLCFDIMDNFTKYQKMRMEKCIDDLENKSGIYEDLMKKYLTLQQLEGEYNNNNNNNNNYYDIDELREIEDIQRTLKRSLNNFGIRNIKENFVEIEQYIFSLDKEINDNKMNRGNKVNKVNRLNNNNEDDNEDEIPSEDYICKGQQSSSRLRDILSKYKYIPKKHKFYLMYQVSNGKVIMRKGGNRIKRKENGKIIHNPNAMPLMTSIENLNKVNHGITSNEEEEIYTLYTSDDDDCSESEYAEDLHNQLRQIETDIDLHKQKNIEDTIRSDDENIHNFLEKKTKDDIIFSSFQYNRYNNSYEELSSYFTLHNDIYEDILLILFTFDYSFAFLFMLYISNINNSIYSLISYITSNIFSRELRTIILTKNPSLLLSQKILDIYFSSFDYTHCSYLNAIRKTFSSFSFSFSSPQADLELIDDLSKYFSIAFYSNYKGTQFVYDEKSLYFITFSLILICIESKRNDDKEQLLCDLIIMLNNLNEGKNYDTELIKESCEWIFKYNGIVRIVSTISAKPQRLKTKVIIEGRSWEYSAVYLKGMFVFFRERRTNAIEKICYLGLDGVKIVKRGLKVIILRKNNGKVLVVENRKGSLGIKKVERIEVEVDSEEVIKDIIRGKERRNEIK